MKKLKYNIIALLVFISGGLTASIDPYHKFQPGIEFGIGDNSAPSTSFPFGTTIGGFFRYQNHTIGARRDYFTELQIFRKADYYRFINIYYGFAIEKKHTIICPQLGFGNFETTANGPHPYNGFGAELSIAFTLHVRGNGIGIRPLFNFNNKVNYVGIFLHANIGWAW